MIGVAQGTVRLEPYDPNWAAEFRDEKQRLQAIFGSDAIIEHIGSTAIPGLLAKPLIDILVALPHLSDAKKYILALEQHGYSYMPERDKDDEVFMPKGPSKHRTHYLHMVELYGERYTNTLLFRDYLRRHPSALSEYATLKSDLATKYANDRYAYTDAKTQFVSAILEKAGHESA